MYKERDSVSRPTLYKYSISTLEFQLIDIADYIIMYTSLVDRVYQYTVSVDKVDSLLVDMLYLLMDLISRLALS